MILSKCTAEGNFVPQSRLFCGNCPPSAFSRKSLAKSFHTVPQTAVGFTRPCRRQSFRLFIRFPGCAPVRCKQFRDQIFVVYSSRTQRLAPVKRNGTFLTAITVHLDARSRPVPNKHHHNKQCEGQLVRASPRRGTLSFVTQKFFCFGAINNRRNIG